jgi:hypothetical protein
MKKKVIVILLIIILVASVSTLVLYNIGGYFLDSAFEAVAAEQSGPVNTDDNAPSSAAPAGSGETGVAGQDDAGEALQPQEPAQQTETEPAGTEAEPGEQQAAPSGEVQAAPTEKDAGTAQTQETAPDQTDAGNGDTEYTQEEMADISDSVSASDKISASLLVLSKLSPEDIQYLYGLMEGGLTPEEKGKAKELCFARFSDEEIEQIYDLYLKYTSGS